MRINKTKSPFITGGESLKFKMADFSQNIPILVREKQNKGKTLIAYKVNISILEILCAMQQYHSFPTYSDTEIFGILPVFCTLSRGRVIYI